MYVSILKRTLFALPQGLYLPRGERNRLLFRNKTQKSHVFRGSGSIQLSLILGHSSLQIGDFLVQFSHFQK